MNLDLTSKEMEILLGLTSHASIQGDNYDTLWRKVSKEFVRNHREVQAREQLKAEA
jgi:hypothetical protein